MKRPRYRSCRMLTSRAVSTSPRVGFPGVSSFQPPRMCSAVVSIFVLYRDPVDETPPLHTSPPTSESAGRRCIWPDCIKGNKPQQQAEASPARSVFSLLYELAWRGHQFANLPKLLYRNRNYEWELIVGLKRHKV